MMYGVEDSILIEIFRKFKNWW